MSSQTDAAGWNARQTMSNEPWRDEIQEYALLIDSIASGDRSRSLKLLASYVLANNDSRGLATKTQLEDAEDQQYEQYGGTEYYNNEDPDATAAYDESSAFVDEGGFQYDENGLEYALDSNEHAAQDDIHGEYPPEYYGYDGAEYNGEHQPEYGGYDDSAEYNGEYQQTYDGTEGIEGAFMSGALSEETDQHDQYTGDGYQYDQSYDEHTGAVHETYHDNYQDDEGHGAPYQNENQAWVEEPGGEWHEDQLDDSYETADTPPDSALLPPYSALDTHMDETQEAHGETGRNGEVQSHFDDENGPSLPEHLNAESDAHQDAEPFPGISFNPRWRNVLEEHHRQDSASWNQDHMEDDNDWEDASVHDERY